MLILSRKVGESIIIGDNLIEVKVLGFKGGAVRLGIRAPDDMAVHREEIAERIKQEKELQENRANYMASR